MKAWAVFKEQDEADAYVWRGACDATLGFPEDPSIHVWAGGGVHAPIALGLAEHFNYETWSKKNKRLGFFVCESHRSQVTPPSGKADEFDDLPEDWETEE